MNQLGRSEESEGNEDKPTLARRTVLSGAAGGLAAGIFGAGTIEQVSAQENQTVTLIHDTHFHGRFESSGSPAKNIVAYDAVVDELRDEHDNALFLGNGDELAPSVLGLENEGEHMIEALNQMGPDAVGVGNHEFDFGVDTATERFQESEFPWLVANLLTSDGEPLPGTERWKTVDVGDVTVGLFGLVVNGFYSITSYPEEYQVLDNVETAKEMTQRLKEEEGADIVVCPAHVSSGKQRAIADEVDGLDAIVGSHSGIAYDEPNVINGTIVSEFGDEFDHLGRLTIDVETGELADWERIDFYNSEADEGPPSDAENHTPRDVAEIEGDSSLTALADQYLTDLEERLGQSVVESEVELNATFDNYAVETGLGNLMTDLMRDVGDLDREIDVAIQNAGGIRSNTVYGPGEISGSDVMNILPFPNEIEVYELSGSTLESYLEAATRPMPGDFGAQPAIQVSGLSYEWWGHGGETEIRNVFVGGKPLDTESTYLVSTNDFVAGRSIIGEEGELVLASGQFQGAYIKERLEEEFETISPEPENRIIRVDEWVDSMDVRRDDDAIQFAVQTPEAAEGIAPDSFRLLKPDGAELPAIQSGTEDGYTARFEGSALDEFVDDSVPDPALRVHGGFDPDEEYYGYENDDGELVELPVSSGYDHYKLQGEFDAQTVLDALSAEEESEETPTETPESESTETPEPTETSEPTETATDGGDADDDSMEGEETDDGSMENEETEDDSMENEDTETSDSDGSGPGFGPLAALSGVGGVAYLLRNRLGADTTNSTESE